MYGGLASTPSQALDDTWAFATSWTQLTPAVSAPPRWGHQMVTNTATGNILTFGGRSPTISGLSNDTMEWTGVNWIAVPTANAPSPRFLYGMAYDSSRDVTVLFGGRDNVGANNETWEFNGITWSQVPTLNAPAPREEMGMVFDASRNRTIVFGGCDEGTSSIYGDTWEYDGSDWVEVTPATSPTPRFRGMMEYDTNRSRTVYFGGFDGTQQLSETYEYGGDQWVQIPTGISVPTSLTEMTAGFDVSRSTTTMFGGFGTTFNNDTWQYTGDTSGTFTLYGSGCVIAAGALGLDGSVPNIGTTLNLSFSNLGTSPAVIVVLGLSDEVWNGIPLPFDLGIINLNGCNLLASADFLDVALAASGTATYDLPIPFNPLLINQSVYAQGIALSLAPLTFDGTSRGGRALIGQ
ncbi:MAG: hypothetical protein ACI91B_001817 [Planctomycetota bacterium]|jgi:hypothetical protein